MAFELDIRHVALHLADFVDGGAVNVAERKVVEQVVKRVDVELFS